MYTWRISTLNEFESGFGIIEKFRYLNQIDMREFMNLLQLNQSMFEIKQIIEMQNTKMIDQLSFITNSEKSITYIEQRIRYCPICIKYGFHSYLHQFSLTDICIYHKTKLYECCPKCNKINPRFNLAIAILVNEPFCCQCGYSHISRKEFINNYLTPSKSFEIADEFSNWIKNPFRMKGNFDILEIYGKVPLNILEIKGNQTLEYDLYDYRGSMNLFEFFIDTKRIFSSISRRFRNKFSADDKKNLRLFCRANPKFKGLSPSAKSYLIWHFYTRMLKDLRAVDNQQNTFPNIWEEPRFFSKRYEHRLQMLYYKLTCYRLPEITIKNVLMKCYVDLLVNDYKRISKLINENESLFNQYLHLPKFLDVNAVSVGSLTLLIDLDIKTIYIKKMVGYPINI